MAIRIKVKNAETGATVEMELENENTIDEVIESAATFWARTWAHMSFAREIGRAHV